MPPAVAAAGIAGAAAIGGAVISSNATKKAVKAQSQAADNQIALARENRDYQYALNAPTITRGNAAANQLAGLLNVGGTSPQAAAAFDAYKGSTGYTSRLTEGLGAVNSNAYARGMGQSGATLKALTRYGQAQASNEFGNYAGQLQGIVNAGVGAQGVVGGVGTNFVNMANQATGNAADANSNAALLNGRNQAQLLQNFANIGANLYGSSYGAPQGAQPQGIPGQPLGNYGQSVPLNFSPVRF